MPKGHFNHKGRPGKLGGSLPKGSNSLAHLFAVLKGGARSGNFEHSGIPGHRGGSQARGGMVNRIRNLQLLDRNSPEYMEKIRKISQELGLDEENDFSRVHVEDMPYVLEAVARLPRLEDGSKISWETHTKESMKYELEALALQEGLQRDAFKHAAAIATQTDDGYHINLHTLKDNEWFSGLNNLPLSMQHKAGTMSAVAAHEYAHAMDKWDQHSATSTWQDAVSKSKISHISPYATSNHKEGFAESVALMSIRPAYFYKKYPELYKAINEMTSWDPASKMQQVEKEMVFEELPERKFVDAGDYHLQLIEST